MEIIKIGEACDILNGFAFKSKNYVDSGIRIIRIANVQKGYIEDNTPAFYPLSTNGLDKYMLKSGDLLISLTGNVGRVALLDKEFLPAALNQRVACLRLKSNFIDKKYLFHILNSDFFEQKCIRSSKGVAQKNMSTEWLKEYEIPLYSAKEQQKIAATLDKLQSIITHRRTQLEKLDLLVKARFVEMFGDPEFNNYNWDTFKMAELCTVSSSKRVYQSELTNEGVPFLRISDLVNRMDYNTETCDLFISEEKYSDLLNNGLVPQKDDILVTARGTLGRCYIVKDTDRFYFQDGMITWLSSYSEKIIPVYISYLFSMHGIKKQIEEMQAGSTVAYLSIAMTKKLSIMLPPLDLQTQFADFVQQVDKSRFITSKEKIRRVKFYDKF